MPNRPLVATLIALATWASPTAASERPVQSLQEMRQEHVVVQQWDLSCGAAALATLLRYQHGENLTEREIAAILVDRPEYLENPWVIRARHGFSLLDLRRASLRLGYEGVGYGQLKMSDLEMLAPIIVPLDLTGYPHFVIYRGQNGNEVMLADPAYGIRTMPAQRFRNAWMKDPELGHLGFVVRAHSFPDQSGYLSLDSTRFWVTKP